MDERLMALIMRTGKHRTTVMSHLQRLRDRHRTLTEAFANADAKRLSPEFQERLRELLGDMQNAVTEVGRTEEFLWLRDAVEQWRKVGPALGVPVGPVLEAPPDLKRELAAKTGDQSLQARVTLRAHELACDRVIAWFNARPVDEIMSIYRGVVGDVEQRIRQDDDWNAAETFLAAELFEGRLDFVRDFGPESYWRLEGRDGGMWLSRVVELKAYFRWKEKGGGWGIEQSLDDFHWAENTLFDCLHDPERKASWMSFDPCRAYIEDRYLERSGRISGKRHVVEWTQAKARRLAEAGHACDGSLAVALAAEFMTGFYENIIPAVLDRSAPSARRVVHALGLASGAEVNRCLVNCFEMAIAMSFLDASQFLPVEEPRHIASVGRLD